MKAVAVRSAGKVEVVDIPMPEIRDYECLVRVRTCGLCSTDLKIIDDHLSNLSVNYPVILGHEGVGEVVEVGSKVRNINVGDVYLNPIGRVASGTPFNRMWAGMIEYAVVQDHKAMDELGIDRSQYAGGNIKLLPAAVSPEDGAMVLALREAYSGVGNFGIREGGDVLIFGDGPIALALAHFARMRGAATVGCVGHWDKRLARFTESGKAEFTVNSKNENVEDAIGERTFDLVIDAVGRPSIIKQGSAMLKQGGKVGVYGVVQKVDSDLCLLELKNNTCVHMLNWPYGEGPVHDEVVAMILDGRVDPKEYYSHVIPADDAAEAVRMVREREAFRVVLKFW